MASAEATAAATQLMDDAKALGKRCRVRDPEISDTEALRRGLKTLLSLMAIWYRDLIHASVETADLIANQSAGDLLARLSAAWPPARSAFAIRAISTAERQLDLNANAQLCLEALLLQLSPVTSEGPSKQR